MAQLAEQARALEDLGYAEIWLPDERLLRNVYVALATVAGATSHIGLGTAVTNPYTRNPALTAAAIATIDELSGGRARLGLGAGGGLGAYGIDRARPVRALRETTEIVRRLTSNQRVHFDGQLFSLRDTQLDFPAIRSVPVYLAARGPKILELAGEIADGVIIGGFADARGLGYAQSMVERGLKKSGRDSDGIDRISWLYVSAAADRQKARLAVSRIVLASLVTSRPILDQLDIDLPRELIEHLDSTGWAFPRETPAEASALLPDHVLDAFAVYGTPDDCIARIEHIRASGLNHVCFVLFPPEGDTLMDLATRLATEVVAHLMVS
jgi:5,10-methylenetetrahydromethanopterin reductase